MGMAGARWDSMAQTGLLSRPAGNRRSYENPDRCNAAHGRSRSAGRTTAATAVRRGATGETGPLGSRGAKGRGEFVTCLLYTSDAADDLLCVDLGGRRIIKK